MEGYTNAKRIQLQIYMRDQGIGILCLQETHKPNSDYYTSEEGYVIIMSGGVEGLREDAGVGYMIAPWMRKSIVSFCQASSRMASPKIRVQGGEMMIITAYAPHLKYEFSDRQDFSMRSMNLLIHSHHMDPN